MVLYNCGIRLYGFAVRIASLWKPKARAWVRGRKGWRVRLAAAMSQGQGPVLWVHCASLGEFEQGRCVMEHFMAQHRGWRLVVSFFSPSGYEVRANYGPAAYVCYLPLDTPRNAHDFVQLVRPQLAVFVKYELWYNVLEALRSAGVETFLISARFRPEQAFFRWYGRWYLEWLQLFKQIFVQDAESQLLLETFEVQGVQVAGDTRFDRVAEVAAGADPVDLVARFVGGGPTLVAGSTWPADEAALGRVVQAMPAGWRAVVVPHEINDGRIRAWMRGLGVPAVRYTADPNAEALAAARVLVVDTVGLLLRIYQYADLAYVGGGFGVGIHNVLEPAAFGVGVLFGPVHRAFREALGLIEDGGAIGVQSTAELEAVLLRLMGDEPARSAMGRAALGYVQSHTGATARVVGCLSEFARGAHAK